MPLDSDWTSFKRRCEYVIQFMNIFNSNLGQLLMTKTKVKTTTKIMVCDNTPSYRIGREKLSRCGQQIVLNNQIFTALLL